MATSESSAAVTVSHRGTAVVATINRPEVRNALGKDVIAGLNAAARVAVENSASAFVLRGAGATFCAGADLRETSELFKLGHEHVQRFVADVAEMVRVVERLPMATIAVVEGYAVAGGFELLAACDIVLASNDACIGDRHAYRSVLPGAGSSARLLASLPRARARYLLLAGDLLSGSEAENWGLVTRACGASELDTELDRVLALLEAQDRAASAAMKRLILENDILDVDAAVATERAVSADYAENSTARIEAIEAFMRRRD